MGTRGADLRAALGDRHLRRLLACAASWYAADVAGLLAVSIMAYELGGPDAVGLVGAARVLPTALLGGLVGFTDRLPRPLMVATVNVGCTGVALALAVTAYAGGTVALLTAVVGVGAALSVVLKPSLASLLPQLVREPEQLAPANSAYGTATSVGSVLGPAAGGGLLAAGGPGSVWLALAVLYAGTAALAASIRSPFRPARRTGSATPGGGWRRLTLSFGGLRAFAGPGARTLFALFMAQRFMLGVVNVVVVLYAHHVASADADRLAGALFTVFGIGGLLGSLLSFAAGARRGRWWFAAGVTLWGLPVALLGAVGGVPGAWVAMTLVGIGNALAGVFGYSLISRLLPDHVAGRAWGAFHSMGAIALAAGSLAAPVLVGLLGLRPAMVGTGAIVAVAPLVGLRGLRIVEAATTPRPEDVELLGRVAVLAPLPRLTLDRLACSALRRDIDAGDTVVREGSAGEEFFVVESGELEVERHGVEVRRLGPGDAFGQVALLRSVPRTASVVAVTPAALLTVTQELFVATVTGHRPTDVGAETSVDELLEADVRRGD